jgi:hypothetical protein
MTLPAAGNPISIAQISAEFVLDSSLSTYRGVTWWTDAGATGTFDSTNLDMSEFYSKRKNSPFTLGYNSLYIGNNYVFDDLYTAGNTASVGLRWNTDGTMSFFNFGSGYVAMDNWGTPTTAGIGSNYWIRFTRTATASFGSPTAATNSTASTGWLQLSTSREIYIERTPGQNFFSATYTIEISSSSGGSPVLTTLTGIGLQLVDDDV